MLPIWNTTAEMIQASSVVYIAANSAHRHEPVSFLIAAIVAIHGKYNSTNSIKQNAVKGVNALKAASPWYKIPIVETIASFAGRPVNKQTDIFQSKPSGRITGSIH